MTEVTELRMNVAALKRVDPYVKDILGTATHVALYTFNGDNNEWEKTGIEGALFVYSRNGEPYNSILIMNRLNTNNLVEPVTQGLDLQLQAPFLLYRNSRCNIYGIWFYEKEECIRIAAMLNLLVKESEENRKAANKPSVQGKNNTGSSANNVDIFSMLSKAQEDFNTNRGSSGGSASVGGGGGGSSSGGGSSGSGVNDRGKSFRSKSPLNTSMTDNMSGPLAAPLGPDVTSQSVMDFFAKAKVNTGHFKAGDHPTAGNTVTSENKPLLARLMSHPAAHTLEHIEKQQRSITPQPNSIQPPQPPPNMTANSSSSTSVLNRSKRRSKTVTQDSTASTPISQELRSPADGTRDTNDSAGFFRIQLPATTVSSNITNHQAINMIAPSNPNPLVSLFAHASVNAATEDVIETTPTLSSGTGSAPALMPPVMFAAPSPAEPISRPLEPLTRNQLLQAFNHLLRSDPDFINKLHEAYVKSFGEILS